MPQHLGVQVLRHYGPRIHLPHAPWHINSHPNHGHASAIRSVKDLTRRCSIDRTVRWLDAYAKFMTHSKLGESFMAAYRQRGKMHPGDGAGGDIGLDVYDAAFRLRQTRGGGWGIGARAKSIVMTESCTHICGWWRSIESTEAAPGQTRSPGQLAAWFHADLAPINLASSRERPSSTPVFRG